MIEILSIVWDWLHWIIFGVGCLTVLMILYALFVAKWDAAHKSEEEIMREISKGEGM